MLRLALILTSAILLTACASTKPPVVAEKPQYCHTSQEIAVSNGKTVDSMTVVECTDDEIKRLFQVKSGMAPNCVKFDYWMQMGGYDVQRQGITCQKPDKSWEIVNTSTGY
jgi:hypothetical protein